MEDRIGKKQRQGEAVEYHYKLKATHGEQHTQDEAKRPRPKQEIIEEGMQPHPWPETEDGGSLIPTPEQRHSWKRKSI